jgi:hypothetical protein
MYVIFPRFGKNFVKKNAITPYGTEVSDTAPHKPVFLNMNDPDHINSVAIHLAKELPGVEILIAKVTSIVETPPGKIRRKEVKDNGEILPA